MPNLRHGTEVPYWKVPEKGKTFHTTHRYFVKRLPTKAAVSVVRGRVNLRPRRWWSSRWLTHTVLACMTREEVFKLRLGPIGPLGTSRETAVDLGKERRTTTKAPP